MKKVCKILEKIFKIVFGFIVAYFAMFGFMAFEDLQALINAMTYDGKYQISELATGWRTIGDFMIGIMAASFFISAACEVLPDLVEAIKKHIVKKHKEITGNE